MDPELSLVGGPLDLDPGDSRVVELLLEEGSDLRVLNNELGVSLPGEPSGVPGPDYADSQPQWMYLLTQPPPPLSPRTDRSPPNPRGCPPWSQCYASSRITVIWLERLRILFALPMARG